MKKILFIALLLASVLQSAWAQDYDFSAVAPSGQTLYYKITDADNRYVSVVPPTGYSWTNFTQPTGSVTIPSSVTNGGTTYSVTAIGNDAFYNCSSLTGVTIPTSVVSLGNDAFRGCSSLTGVIIPNSVTSIGNTVFYGCSSLTGVTISSSVTSIGSQVFSECSSLATLTVDGGNTHYDSRNNCNALIETATNTLMAGTKNTVIPNTVTSIGAYAFRGHTGLTNLTIPNSVTTMGISAFSGCSGLTSVIIPNSVTTIGGRTFFDCSGLTSVIIPISVTTIGAYAFAGCSGLTHLSVPNSVITIEGDAFNGVDTVYYRGDAAGSPWGAATVITDGYTEDGDPVVYESPYKTIVIDCNTAATNVIIPNSVASIESYAFEGCGSLTSVTIPNSVAAIGRSAFEGCSGLTSLTIPNSVTTIGERAFLGCSGLTSLTIPNSVTTIGGRAFLGCSGLTSLTIGNSVTTIGESAFFGCINLETLYYNAKNLTTIEFIANYPQYCGFRLMPLQTLVIGESVETLPEDVFYGQSNVETLYYNAKNLTTTADWYNTSEDYDNYGFRMMPLQTLVIGNSVETLPEGVFYGQNDLASLTIGNSVKTIGNMAFQNCSGLTSLTIPDSVTSIGMYAFSGCTNLSGALTIPSSVTYISAGAFYNCSSLESVAIPNSVTEIRSNTFMDCSGLTSVSIGSSVTKILEDAFRGCTNVVTLYYNAKRLLSNSWSITNVNEGFRPMSLHTLVIGDSVEALPEYVFSYQSNLSSVTIPNSVRTIGKYAFCGCSGLERVETPNSVTSIGGSAFSGCSSLTGVTIPNSLTSISEYTFYGCSGLQSFVVPPSMTSIGSLAFDGCNSLKTVYNLSDLNIVKGSTTHGRVAYNANRVVVPAQSGFGANTLYQIPESYSFVAAEDEVETHIPRATIPNIDNLIYKDGTTWKAKKIVLTDDTSRFSAPVAFTADSAVYVREFTNGNRSTLYLPFSAAVPSGFEVYDFADFSDDVIRFASHEGDIAAYTPYLVGYDLAKDGSSTTCTIKAANAVFPQSAAASYHPVTKNGLTFQGVIARTQMSTDNYGYSNGYFVRSGGNAHVNPFRCYFSATGSAPASTLMVDILDGGVGIDDVEASPESPVRYSNDVYDMMGRLVRRDAENLRGLPQGIYIWRGKKVFAY